MRTLAAFNFSDKHLNRAVKFSKYVNDTELNPVAKILSIFIVVTCSWAFVLINEMVAFFGWMTILCFDRQKST